MEVKHRFKGLRMAFGKKGDRAVRRHKIQAQSSLAGQDGNCLIGYLDVIKFLDVPLC